VSVIAWFTSKAGYNRRMWRLGLRIALLFVIPMPMATACAFQYDPASMPTYYRANGWTLPVQRTSIPQ
jgi:hypothetical protein